MTRAGSAIDPLWYKDAIIYELHVKAFCDSNNDGIGDLRGLIQKLDYLQDLGVTCLWLLPFFPSPLRDDGYDISDYLNIHPDYGTMDDFRLMLDSAHERGLQVMIELVVNHTSDQHAWFQAARHAPPGSPERDFYVWSDTDQKYRDARIIFTDTEKSNWTWDPVAKAYYWHRFFSHQPDLNFDNPAVVEEVLAAMRYWLDMGVDGLRLDAIPYLVERDGTNCENLPETHILIKRVRAEMDLGYANRVILAEANQWPSDVRPYFGDGDECHMAFHFPLMPRIFMALRLEDRLPITDIMGQTPEIPESCQWGLFLRNHDELTLEMVSEEERDYMYLAYSADPRMRINIGIRRRLAPLMDNNRRRIELLNSLLFSFPGTPILYYGDEIGMGDNIYLGDRNGVRTPMQWNADRNAGFSRVTPAKLYSPLIMDPVYGYEAVNVEAEQSDSSSLLHWMRNMIALRKLFHVFGRGSLEFLSSSNRKVLAYVRRYEGEQVLCVANLSRFAQAVELDLSAFDGLRPVEMLGYVQFPTIGRRPYTLTPGPYGFLWFELQRPPEPESPVTDLDRLHVGAGWEDLLDGSARGRLEGALLPAFLAKQRWFGAKSRRIASTAIADWGALPGSGAAIVFVDVRYEDGGADTYLLPLALTVAEEPEIPAAAIVCPVTTPSGDGVLHDAAFDAPTRDALLAFIERGGRFETRHGAVVGKPSAALGRLRGEADAPLTAARASAEQSNTSIVYGKRLILKLFRRQEPGVNPDCEVGRYLTDVRHFAHVPPFAGTIDYERDGAPYSTLAMLQALVAHQGDGWTRTLEHLDRFLEECGSSSYPAGEHDVRVWDLVELSEQPESAIARELLGISLDDAMRLGQRTAEMHLALAAPTEDPAFAPEPLTDAEARALGVEFFEHGGRVFDELKEGLSALPDEIVEVAGLVLSRRRAILDRFRQLGGDSGWRTRIHGDYHLGQVVAVKNDYVILDFEGEPSRSLAERRARHSPLKDVAGMLRSYSYAAWSALSAYAARRPESLARLEPWAILWQRSVSGAFLRAYRTTAGAAPFLPATRDGLRTVLAAYVTDKALYEVRYELNHRPDWVRIPLRGVLELR